jgi:MscS family membrane protein
MSFQTILATTFLGNNVVQYVIFIAIIIGAFIGSKILYFLFSKIFKMLTKKTKTQLDDILVDALQGPVVFAIIIAGLFYGGSVLVMGETFEFYYYAILSALVIFNVAWFVSRIVTSLLANYLEPMAQKKSSKRTDTIYPLLKKIFNFVIYTVAILLVLDNLGVKITGLIAGLGIGGLAFALAAQDILSNFFGGAAVLTDKPFQVGDRIITDGQDGFVRKIGLRSTVMETFDGTHIVVPNKRIADSVLENVSREKARRVKTVLTLEYSTSTKKLQKAKEILASIVKKNPSTKDDSLIHFIAFGDSALELQLIYWIDNLDVILQAKDEVNFEIKKAFEKEKIEFAYPSQTIYVKK